MARPKLEHITSNEYTLSLVAMYAIYIVITLTIIMHSLFWYIVLCLGIFLSLRNIQSHFLMWLNERRCEAVEVKSEVSSDDDKDDKDTE